MSTPSIRHDPGFELPISIGEHCAALDDVSRRIMNDEITDALENAPPAFDLLWRSNAKMFDLLVELPLSEPGCEGPEWYVRLDDLVADYIEFELGVGYTDEEQLEASTKFSNMAALFREMAIKFDDASKEVLISD